MSDEGKDKSTASPKEAEQTGNKPPPPPRTPGSAPGVATRSAGAAAALVGKAAGEPPPPPPGPVAPTPVSAPPAPHRPPMPTLGQPPPEKTGTLRPPAAVPPPPRQVPASVTEEPKAPAEEEAPDGEDRTGQPQEPTAPPTEEQLAPPTNLETVSAPDAATNPLAASEAVNLPAEDSRAPLPAFDLDESISARPTGPQLAGTPAPGPEPPGIRPSLGVIAIMATVVVLLLVVVVLLVARSRAGSATTVSAPPPAPRRAGKPSAGRSAACSVVTNARRLAEAASIRVEPVVASIGGSARAAVGFAESSSTAVGMTVDPSSMDVDQPFRERGHHHVAGVVPMTRGGVLRFIVDGDDTALTKPRTVDAEPPLTIGTTREGLSVAPEGGKPRLVWSLNATDATVPRIATVDVGHVVVVRIGGQSGKVRVGWLTPAGSKKTDLQVLETDRLVGTPTAAAGPQHILVAAASRPDRTTHWTISIAKAGHGAIPSKTKRFAIPPGGPGGEAISPSATSLPGGRWLLQWTEGSSGSHRVRAQVLGSDLVPEGAAINLSPEGSNAGKGVVWANGRNAITLFFVKTDRGVHELWGASLSCG